MGIDLKFEGSDLQRVIEVAVIQAIGDAGRDALLKDVVKHPVTEGETHPYTNRKQPSPLIAAMRTASERIASKILTERLEKDPEFIAQVDAIYADAVKRFFDSDTRAKVVERLAGKLGEAFSERGY